MQRRPMIRPPFMLALWLILSPLGTAAADDGWRALNQAVIAGHVIPRYQALARAHAGLRAQVDLLCGAPDVATLDLARAHFAIALDAWNAISHIRFGPIQSDQRFFRFQLWPDKRGTGERQVRGFLAAADESLLEPGAFYSQSVAVQGLSALELLLFPVDSVSLEDLAPGAEAGFRCRFAQAITRNLSAMSESVSADWTGGEASYALRLARLPADGVPFGSDADLAGVFLNSLATQVQVIAGPKLADPLGASAEEASPRRADSWRSARDLANVCTNLRAVGHLYDTGFAQRLRATPETRGRDGQVSRALAGALHACLEQPVTLSEGASDPAARAGLTRLRDRVEALRVTTGSALADDLDLTLGFNSMDGD